MNAFDIPFHHQVRNVLGGQTADGTRNHALWPLRGVAKHPDILDALFRVALTHLYRIEAELAAREDLRTYVIWATAAHLSRILKRGNTLETATREVSWMSLLMMEKSAFLNTCPFARALMPTLTPRLQPPNRRDLRKDALDILRICQRSYRPRDDAPDTDLFEVVYSVVRYTQPRHYLSNPFLAPTWTDHIAAVTHGDNADHVYWTELAHRERLVFALFIGDACRATFESHDGQLQRLVVNEPADDQIYNHLSSALSKLRYFHGNVFRLPPSSTSPSILRLIATNSRRMQELENSLARIKTTRARVLAEAMERAKTPWNAPPRPQSTPPLPAPKPTAPFTIPGTTDDWLLGGFALLLLSFLIPVLIVLAPALGRTYVRAWGVALGITPPCTPPAQPSLSHDLACVMPDGSPQPPDKRVPIP